MNRIVWIFIMFFLATNVAKASDFLFSPINVSHGLSDNQVRYILQLPDGRMIFTTSGSLNVYDGFRFKYIHRENSDIYPISRYDGHYRMYHSEDSLLWIKDAHKLMCVNLHQEEYIPDLGHYFKHRGINEEVEDFFVDSDQRWWFLTADGLLQYDTSDLLDISDNIGRLQDLASDKDHLYLFYNTGAVVCYDLKTKAKRYVASAYPVEEQVLFSYTSLVVKGHDGLYQLRNGSKGGFFFFDTQKRSWEKLLETDYTLNTLVVTGDGTAYISCTNGIWVIDRKRGERQYLPNLKTVNGRNIHTEISTLFLDKQGGLWLGTFNMGLLYHHASRYKFLHIGRSYFPESSTDDVIVQSFAEDSSGNIYLKAETDFFQYSALEERGKNLIPVSSASLPEEVAKKLNEATSQMFQDHSYTAIHTDLRGWNWLGTSDGLKLVKPEKQVEQIFYTEDGLSNNFIHAILEDRHHNLWITTSYGISKVLVGSINENIQFINYNSLDGTLEGEYADGAAFEARDGRLFFGGVNGFNILNADRISSPPLPFKPVFTNLFLQGKRIIAGNQYDGRSILTRATPYTKEIELSFNQNFLTLEYSALNYLNPFQTRYRYQLEGIDNNWIEVFSGSESFRTNGILSVSYTNLPPGEYLFRVMASDNNNQWDATASDLKIIIHAPWWKTKTAYVLYILSVLLIIVLSVYFYLNYTRNKLERKHREELLIQRIRNLIEQQSLLEGEKESNSSKITTNPSISEGNNQLSPIDAEFLSKAIKVVERNLYEPNYSVAQLSRDLCMDRTGLYRKLISIMDKSPSSFIRRIRLERAAQLILEEEFSITEIAEKVGFNSSSYFSKCFQSMYGCRPSEYQENFKKST